LKEWNRKDPPDADERIRNDRIATYENARNPFIDHPEFVDRIDFTP
jgi:deoxyribonuclease-1